MSESTEVGSPEKSLEQCNLHNPEIVLMPPPPYSGLDPEPSSVPPVLQWSTPVIAEEAAKQALVEYAARQCCYRTSPAENMVVEHLQPFCIYRYRLESYIESRTLKTNYEPYYDEKIDSNGTPPTLWEMHVDTPPMFEAGQKRFIVPYTSSVKTCHRCTGSGKVTCWSCGGTLRTTCSSCGGTGRLYNGNSCWGCGGRGRRMCYVCSGGKVTCDTCLGRKKLHSYIEMEVIWTNIDSPFVTDQNSGLPMDRYEKVTGKKIFIDEQPMVVPIMSFPDPAVNNVSVSYVQQHNAKFADNPRIIRQRQTIELIALTKVSYTWGEKPHTYFVYGEENRVYTDNYPAKCCCIVM
ncbi:protein SSUH2 homolog isoform X2 [Pleurodeles waltl]|uniref:protein SSUH2 homolog isoform X2 n=1 Tax=Pleurodeles waltl TaxID=8319 RepID=UPI0037098A76